VERALRMAPGVYDKLLGVVLNKVDLNLLGRYESHHRDYFYNRHYARYGYVD
jgi:succinoglycan biosynthesis transport protein ExoP